MYGCETGLRRILGSVGSEASYSLESPIDYDQFADEWMRERLKGNRLLRWLRNFSFFGKSD